MSNFNFGIPYVNNVITLKFSPGTLGWTCDNGVGVIIVSFFQKQLNMTEIIIKGQPP